MRNKGYNKREVEIEIQMISTHKRKYSIVINNFLKKQEVMNILKNLLGRTFLKYEIQY